MLPRNDLISKEARAILGIARRVFAGTSELPFVVLDAHRRRVLGGHLFQEAPLLVEAVAEAMIAHAHLFSHMTVTGRGLRERQERARTWKALRDMLTRFAELANDGYLSEQSAAVDEAIGVLRQGELEAALPYSHDPQRIWRERVLVGARLLLRHRQEQNLRRQREGEGKKKQSSG